ncbi:MAG: hypothetical protein NTU47_04360 [Ignavibacteriales bacterium]|nr:hypothetical protein [Ignavibacteriales bacterium]
MGFLFASLFKRANGVWYILYTHQGRQRWISTKTKQKAEALKRLKSFQEPPSDQPKSISLSEFTKEFLAFAEANDFRGSYELG